MPDLEIPIGKRTPAYRFYEMLPAFLSYGSIILLVALSLLNPLIAAAYLLAIIITTLIKAVGIAYHTTTGRNQLEKAQKVDWHDRLKQLENPSKYIDDALKPDNDFAHDNHAGNLKEIIAHPNNYPKPSQIYNAVIIATYNESYDILQPTIQSLVDSTYDKKHMIVVVAYEARGGAAIKDTVHALEREFRGKFKDFLLVEHPNDLPNEVRGKGGNITYAGFFLKDWLDKRKIKYSDVIVTTLDADNRTHPTYFDYLTYEYVVHLDRKNLSYQPICLFINNIWDAPAPMRVVATGNSFWNIISSMRPHTLRNFASHSQPMDALVEMNFWSTRTIVEDGHQYWRSYFHFKGNYGVVSIFVPIYQDAVLSSTYLRTLKAQFIQLRRWAYGASDIAYVATRIFTDRREVPLGPSLARLIRLIDGHVTLASIAILIAIGGWVPLFVNGQAAHSIAAHQLPEVISHIQQIALVGLFITVFFAFKMLPPRPLRYKRHRNVWMILQWFLMPVTAIVYSSASAFTSQTALLLGRYFDKFDVTEKATVKSKSK
ncbi:MAG: glycosyltransferase family 2 protein [Candidatus Nomurabacteria bacterium]|nr:MAG: glycosyltransferase family 2 protein [Candidatus Nomurabacteria bacterium]